MSSVRQNDLYPANKSHTMGAPSLRLSMEHFRAATPGFDPGTPFCTWVTFPPGMMALASMLSSLPVTHEGQRMDPRGQKISSPT